MTLVVALIALLAYLLGSIPFGLIVGKSRGIDVREHGSKNIGATNVWRVLGKKFGLFTFACDLGKGWLAVLLGQCIAMIWVYYFEFPHLEGQALHLKADYAEITAKITAAIGCILGHNFPVWLRFKGGKGVATSLGVIFGMMPLAALIVFAIWGLVLKVSRYVSLASLVGAVALPVTVIVLMFFWPRHLPGGVHGWAYFYFACAAAILVVRRHRENIRRLVAGTENRFGKSSST